MVEPSTAAKGAGGALVLGGGGTGTYYAVKTYEKHRLDNLEVRDYIKETETLVSKIEYVDVLNDDDGYLVKLGEAYSNYNLIYVMSGEGYVKEISDSMSGYGTSENKELGKKIKEWCKDKISKNEVEFREKIKRWCIKRPTNSEKVRELFKDKTLKTKKEEFNNGDYERLSEKLKELNLLYDDGWLTPYRSEDNGRLSVSKWCDAKANDLYYDRENKVFELIKETCL